MSKGCREQDAWQAKAQKTTKNIEKSIVYLDFCLIYITFACRMG